MNVQLRRLVLVAGLCVVAVLANRAPARAVSELCPATSEFQRIGDPSSTTYCFAVDATGPRTVSGDIVVKADGKWYSFPFPALQLSEASQHWRTADVAYTKTVYESAPIYVRFPSPIADLAAYVSDAETSGETQYKWDLKGKVACSPTPGFSQKISHMEFSKFSRFHPPILLNPRTDMASAPAAASIITPKPISVPGPTDCAVPFAPATVTDAVAPEYPDTTNQDRDPALVDVTVIVDANGGLSDAWVSVTSGRFDVDNAALRAVRASKFRAGTAFCEAVAGEYVFRGEFIP